MTLSRRIRTGQFDVDRPAAAIIWAVYQDELDRELRDVVSGAPVSADRTATERTAHRLGLPAARVREVVNA